MCRSVKCWRRYSEMNCNATAPSSGPSTVPLPPITTMITISTVMSTSNSRSGKIVTCWNA